MKLLLLLLLAALPVYAEEPAGIVISPEEQRAIIDKFEAMQHYIEKLESGYKICQQLRQS